MVKPENPFRLRFGIWAEGNIVGSINLEPLEDHKAMIGYWVGKEHENKGYTIDALTALASFAFEQLGYEELVAEAVDENSASRRVLEKAGFRETGEMIGRFYTNDLGEKDMRLYVQCALQSPH